MVDKNDFVEIWFYDEFQTISSIATARWGGKDSQGSLAMKNTPLLAYFSRWSGELSFIPNRFGRRLKFIVRALIQTVFDIYNHKCIVFMITDL